MKAGVDSKYLKWRKGIDLTQGTGYKEAERLTEQGLVRQPRD